MEQELDKKRLVLNHYYLATRKIKVVVKMDDEWDELAELEDLGLI